MARKKKKSKRKKKSGSDNKEADKMNIKDLLGIKKTGGALPEVPRPPQQPTQVLSAVGGGVNKPAQMPPQAQKLPQELKYLLDNYLIEANNDNMSLELGLLYGIYVETKKLRELIEQNK